MPQQKELNMCHPDGTPWVAKLVIGDTFTNLQTLADEHPDVGHVLRASQVNFLTESDTRLLFVKASEGHLPISPTKPGINQEGLFFVVSHAYSDGTHYEIVNDGRYTQSGRPFGKFKFTEAKLKDKRSNLLYIRRNIRLRRQFNKLACIHYLRVHENPIAEKTNHLDSPEADFDEENAALEYDSDENLVMKRGTRDNNSSLDNSDSCVEANSDETSLSQENSSLKNDSDSYEEPAPAAKKPAVVKKDSSSEDESSSDEEPAPAKKQKQPAVVKKDSSSEDESSSDEETAPMKKVPSVPNKAEADSSSSDEVEAAPPASITKPLKKGKRDAEQDLDIQVSKKQKKDLIAAVQKEKAAKKIPKKVETSSSDSSDSEEEQKEKAAKKIPKKVETSSSDSSDSEEEQKTKKTTKKVTAKEPPSKLKDDSSEDDDDSSSDEEPAPAKKQPEPLKKDKVDSSSSEDDSSSDEETAPVKKQTAKALKSSKVESSSSEDDSEEPAPAKKQPVKKDSSSEDDSSSDEETAPVKKVASVPKKAKADSSSSDDGSSDEEPAPAKKQPAGVEKPKAESESSEDETSSDEESAPVKKQPAASKNAKAASSSSEGESSSDEELTPAKKKPTIGKKAKAAAKDSSSSEDDSDEESDDEKPPTKKPKVSSTKTSKQETSSDESSEESDEEESEDEKVTPKKKDSDIEMVDAEQKSNAKQPKTPTIQGGSKTLFAGNLSYAVQRSDIEDFFKEAGEVVDVRIASHEDGKPKGYGHVEFVSAEAAQKAMELNGNPLLGRDVRLDLANEMGHRTPRSSNPVSYGVGSQFRKLYVRGFDTSLGEDELKDAFRNHFSTCGEVGRISLPTDRESGVMRGMAYIDMKSGFDEALQLSGSEMGGGYLTVEEARPRDSDGSGSNDRPPRDNGGRFSNRRGRGPPGRGPPGRGRGRFSNAGRGPSKPSLIASAQGKKTVFNDEE